MMLGVYIARPMTQNPWIRKHLHFRHHKMSGTASDLEERAITNGEKWGIRRLLMTGDLIIGFYLRIRAHIMEPLRLYKEGEITKEDLHNVHTQHHDVQPEAVLTEVHGVDQVMFQLMQQ